MTEEQIERIITREVQRELAEVLRSMAEDLIARAEDLSTLLTRVERGHSPQIVGGQRFSDFRAGARAIIARERDFLLDLAGHWLRPTGFEAPSAPDA